MSFAVFLLGNMIAAFSLSGADDTIGQSLDCTTDLTDMFCEVEAQNCTEYNLTFRSNLSHGEEHCILEQCDSGRCCCTIQMMITYGATHTATVWRGGKSMGSKNIIIKKSVKPRVPTIVSVKEVDGSFQVMWKTNMKRSYTCSLFANVTYYKKGDTRKVCDKIEPSEVDGLLHCDIRGQDLEPSTTYVVSVRSYTDCSDRYSDSSREVEFTTPMPPDVLYLAIIISLSIVAVIISGVIYGCYVKLKRKWWDTAAKCPNPKLLNINPSELEVLKPVLPVVSTVCVEPSKPWSKVSLTDTSSGSLQQSSGISSDSSCLSHANTEPPNITASVMDATGKALANIIPIPHMTTNTPTELNKNSVLLSAPCNLLGVRADDTSSGSSCFDNRTYFIRLPSDPPHITMDSSEVQAQAEMLCDSAYHTGEGDSVISANQHVPACPPVVSSLLSTNMSYQQCNGDSGRFSNSDDSNLSSISSGTNTSCDPVSRVEAGCESSDEVVSGATMLNGNNEWAIKIDENPCYKTHSFPPMDDDYQPFQNLVDQPSCLFSEKRSDEEEEPMSKYPEESFAKMPQSLLNPAVSGFINNVQGGQCHSELHSPFLSLIPADQSMPAITDSA